MWSRLRFAFTYALRNMLRDRQRTAFTLLCIAAGVATVVALRTLGLMLTDALTGNVQAYLRGDARVTSGNSDTQLSIFGNSQDSLSFSQQVMDEIAAWTAERGIEITYVLSSELSQVAVVKDDRAGRPALGMSNFIDPKVYPFYDTILAENPARVPLAELFTGPNQVVLGRRMADQTGARVGDQVRVGQAEQLFTVTGIVPDAAESTMDNPLGLMFSFVYLDRAQLADFQLPAYAADRAFLKVPEETSIRDLESQIRREWPQTVSVDGRRRPANWSVQTTDEVLRSNEFIADAISRFVLLLSVVGLVIGGVGIINTMLVAVNRRSLEIAVLKTVGMQGADVSLVFLAEALLAGLGGSLIGIILGFALSLIAREVGESAFAIGRLPWRVYPDPIVIGLALGIAITVFFSFLPTIIASRIRPNLVLRAGSIPMARAGCLTTLLTLLLLIIGIGLLADLIIGSNRFNLRIPPPLTLGIVGTAVIFILLAVIAVLMWLLVWLLGKIPSFRSPSLRIAIRGLTTHRGRTAFSLLALIIGMTALSGTLILARSLNILLYTSISEPIGGNVIILPLPLVQGLVRARLDGLDGVNGYRDVRFTSGYDLESIDGNRNYDRWFNSPEDPQADLRKAQLEILLGIDVHGNPRRGTLMAGRFLTPEDAGQDRIVIPYLPELDAAGVKIGSTFTYRVSGGRRRTFEVVGIVAPDARTGLIPFSLGDSAIQVPLDSVPRTGGLPVDFVIVDAKSEAVDEVMANVAGIPGLFVFDVTLFDSIISRLMNQMAALPILVAGLSLFAATALIATTVALATMERRRQIAMLKAIGVSRWQALGQLLIENGIVGMVGGLISLLPTALILLAVPALSQGIIRLPTPLDLIAAMLALSVIVTLAATLVTSWSASAETPLAALRYE